MSMHSYTVRGMGIVVYELDEDNIIEFIKNHSGTVKKIGATELLDVINSDDPFAAFDDCEIYEEDNNPYALIGQIMTEETGIEFQYERGQDDCSSYPTVMFAERMPWQYSETERKMSEEDLDDVISRYKDELGDEEPYPWVEVEYYG